MLFDTMVQACGFDPEILETNPRKLYGEDQTAYIIKNPLTNEKFFIVEFSDGLFSVAAKIPEKLHQTP